MDIQDRFCRDSSISAHSTPNPDDVPPGKNDPIPPEMPPLDPPPIRDPIPHQEPIKAQAKPSA